MRCGGNNQSGSLPDVAFFKYVLDVANEIVLVSTPVGRDEQTEGRFAEKPFNDDATIQTFDEFAQKVQVLLIFEHTEGPPHELRSQGCSTHDVKVVNLQSVNSDA